MPALGSGGRLASDWPRWKAEKRWPLVAGGCGVHCWCLFGGLLRLRLGSVVWSGRLEGELSALCVETTGEGGPAGGQTIGAGQSGGGPDS